MKFDELDARMRVYEEAHDYCVLPGIHMVARLDGRCFTRLTREIHRFEAPCDEKFRDFMLNTTEHLMAEFSAIYGYTQSDEISLLFPLSSTLFNRKLRKMNSTLAGCASSRLTLDLGSAACFDCRICELPLTQDVVDYFRWRSEDAHRNALNSHCYWTLRKKGESVKGATESLLKLSVPAKNELLFQHGINFNDLPKWQRRGIGLYWEDYEKEGMNPVTGKKVTASRRRVIRDMNLPMRDAYSEFIIRLLDAQSGEAPGKRRG